MLGVAADLSSAGVGDGLTRLEQSAGTKVDAHTQRTIAASDAWRKLDATALAAPAAQVPRLARASGAAQGRRRRHDTRRTEGEDDGEGHGQGHGKARREGRCEERREGRGEGGAHQPGRFGRAPPRCRRATAPKTTAAKKTPAREEAHLSRAPTPKDLP